MQLTLKKRNDLIVMLTKAAEATEKHLVGRTITMEGKRWTARSLAALLTGHAQAQRDAAAQYARWLQATRTLRKQLRADIIPAMFGLRAFTASQFGTGSSIYCAFGFSVPRKRGPKPHPKTLAASAAKARATRKARGTTGKKQRQAIKGAVTPATPP
jgi:hypothetical protein